MFAINITTIPDMHVEGETEQEYGTAHMKFVSIFFPFIFYSFFSLG